MTDKTTPPEDVGVIIGRFQAHELHEGHRQLIETVRARHDRVIAFLGLSVLRGTISDPLDFNARKVMFAEEYPDVEVYYIEDCRDDQTWSTRLDREIRKWKKPTQTVRLYGSRDSFVSHYHGEFPITELESDTYISATEIRRRISNKYKPTRDFRAGVIAASFNRYVGCLPTVDIAVLKQSGPLTCDVLLGKKAGETAWRFIGGFADPTSKSYEEDALRELHEEAGPIEVSRPQYIGSVLVDDWRFRSQPEKLKTLFFVCNYIFGRPEAGDDIEVVGWHSGEDIFDGHIDIVPEHAPLVEMLKQIPIKTLRIQDRSLT